jgi:hypothetical protein
MKDYIYRGIKVPTQIIEEIGRYLFHQIQPGACVAAILNNQLQQAFAYSTEEVSRAMHAITVFVYNEIPSLAQGTPEKVHNWLETPLNVHLTRINAVSVSPYFSVPPAQQGEHHE